MNEREFRVWTAVIAASMASGGVIETAATHADRALELYRERQCKAMAAQYVPPAPFV